VERGNALNVAWALCDHPLRGAHRVQLELEDSAILEHFSTVLNRITSYQTVVIYYEIVAYIFCYDIFKLLIVELIPFWMFNVEDAAEHLDCVGYACFLEIASQRVGEGKM
jgi:hypothetical protein